jgi:hypothetical protein
MRVIPRGWLVLHPPERGMDPDGRLYHADVRTIHPWHNLTPAAPFFYSYLSQYQPNVTIVLIFGVIPTEPAEWMAFAGSSELCFTQRLCNLCCNLPQNTLLWCHDMHSLWKKDERNGFPHPLFWLSSFNVVLSADMSKVMVAFFVSHTRFPDVFILNNVASLSLNCTFYLVLLCLPFTVYYPMQSK